MKHYVGGPSHATPTSERSAERERDKVADHNEPGVPLRRRIRQLRICLTGEQQSGRYLVRVGGAEAWLTGALLCSLCKLAAGRLKANAAGSTVRGSYVQRLRKALDDATGRHLGASLIRPVGKGRYVLALPSAAIRVASSFRHVLLTNCVEEIDANELIAHCGENDAESPARITRRC